jgi:restriction endonuclease Mrr
LFITTSQFSKNAREYVNRIEKRIVLIDGEQLAQLMMDFGVGVAGDKAAATEENRIAIKPPEKTPRLRIR